MGGGRRRWAHSGYNYGGCCGYTSKTAGRWGVTLDVLGASWSSLCLLDSRLPQTAGGVMIVRI